MRRRRSRAWLPLAVTLTLVAQITVLALTLSESAVEACAGTRPPVAARVLLLSGGGQEPGYAAWRRVLMAGSVPHTAWVATKRRPLRRGDLVDRRGRPRFQAVVAATPSLAAVRGDRLVPAFSRREHAVLAAYERRFAIREIVANPGGEVPGLSQPPDLETLRTTAQLTPLGRRMLPDLRGPVPVEGSPALPARLGRGAQAVLTDRRGRALMALVRRGGRTRLVSLVTFGAVDPSFHGLAPAALDWATRGVRLGAHRSYLSAQIDDLFLPNARWSYLKKTGGTRRPIRMTVDDVRDLVRWQRSRRFRLDMAFNGFGADARRPPGCVGVTDRLSREVLRHKDEFHWVSHTYRHLNLDDESPRVLRREIRSNVAWARRYDLPIDPEELVTGEHSGLENPALPRQLRRTGIRWIASDASKRREQYRIGPALTVPRWAPNLFFDVGTWKEQLRQFNLRYHERCRRFCLPRLYRRGFLAREARRLLLFTLGNDPRPFYLHQSNLAEDRTLYPLFDALLRRYRSLTRRPLEHVTLREAGEELRRRARWRSALRAGRVSARVRGGTLRVAVRGGAVPVPVTDGKGPRWVVVRPARPAEVRR